MKRLKIFRIVLLILICISAVPLNRILNVEPRTRFVSFLIDGGLLLISLFSMLLTYFMTNILYEKNKVRKVVTGILQSIVLIVFSIMVFFFYSLASVYEDKLIYKQINNDQYIIFQKFFTGLNQVRPVWRIIETKKLEVPIRRIKYIDGANFDFLPIDLGQMPERGYPKSFLFRGKKYSRIQ